MKKVDLKKIPTKTIAVSALLAALTMAATAVIAIPVPATGGYINFGDGIVLFSGVVFGPIVGLIVGGLGSMLADLATGYAGFMLATFISKGIEGAVAGLIFMLFKKLKLNRHIAFFLSAIPAALIMMLGYFLSERVMFGSWETAAAEIPGNLIQGASGVAIAYIIILATVKIKGFSNLVGRNQFYDYATVGKCGKKATENSVSEDETEDN